MRVKNMPIEGAQQIRDAALTLEELAQGIDPQTKTALPKDSVVHATEVIRALNLGARALARDTSRALRHAQLPQNTGKPWTAQEDQALREAYESGVPVEDIAQTHQRTVNAIAAKLEALQLLKSEEHMPNRHFMIKRRKASPPANGQ